MKKSFSVNSKEKRERRRERRRMEGRTEERRKGRNYKIKESNMTLEAIWTFCAHRKNTPSNATTASYSVEYC